MVMGAHPGPAPDMTVCSVGPHLDVSERLPVPLDSPRSDAQEIFSDWDPVTLWGGQRRSNTDSLPDNWFEMVATNTNSTASIFTSVRSQEDQN
jgi:hypothetical protein